VDGLVRLFDERQEVPTVWGVQNDRRARVAAARSSERREERDERDEIRRSPPDSHARRC
jgi:hypothetical protein